MSVVHFVLKRHPTFSEPVRSKVCFSMWLCSSVCINTQLVSERPGFESRRSLNFFTLLLFFKCWNCSSPATTIALRELSSISPWKKIQCNPNFSIWFLAICVNFHVSKYLRSSTLMYSLFFFGCFPFKWKWWQVFFPSLDRYHSSNGTMLSSCTVLTSAFHLQSTLYVCNAGWSFLGVVFFFCSRTMM